LRAAAGGGGEFAPSKSQRRCWRKNQDLVVTIDDPTSTHEKFELYQKYQLQWHQKSEEDHESFVSFLYDSPVQSVEFCYRDGGGRLLAVGICDVTMGSLSSVYFYHDPDQSHRGIGIFGALYEIARARSLGIPYYYLGYWVHQCAAMEYKASFRPFELLDPDGVWRAGNEPAEKR
jgi:arginyl-tRNA--protein-N-Asp/Glu arginylyltransferase